MKRVEGVEDLNRRIICAQGIVRVGAIIRTRISSCPAEGSRSTERVGSSAATALLPIRARVALAIVPAAVAGEALWPRIKPQVVAVFSSALR